MGVALAAPLAARNVDDSYTIARRFEQYRGHYDGLAWPAIAPRPGQSMLFDRAYKTLPMRDLAMDIFCPPPASNRGQAIVLVHGGAWMSGSKAHFYALADRLAGRGYTVFLPEYRLSPEAPYPAAAIDIADALAFVRAHGGDYGVTPGHVALGGASSGGQLAALVAYNPAFYGQNAPNALIDLDGVLDFTTPLALHYENAAGPQSPAARWLGGSYEQAAPRWAEASAAAHVGPSSPPTLIISSGNTRFTAGADSVLATLARHHTRAKLFTYAKAPHDFWLFDPFLAQVVDQIDSFLLPPKPGE